MGLKLGDSYTIKIDFTNFRKGIAKCDTFPKASKRQFTLRIQ